ncbi:MAG: 2-amino-4-hydroxy-6-hydroxymethyldihydropteridine diphosphokinase [Chloroherpetonaceae bacterium]|nr:2-amino-4-hydroxy-6-hydroxymethyldihydropteridine diphosphokinase [Chloroherpetonaceae bacterium]MCS7210213.1 2-amino-4-hydroxy-6-hydroxymethyldihydropteridine diphosphokinase [Chloroherpetonaceae bacterium]MDW8018484.1 2-amino-4-hydroxy-6-hydroxymethyldihydropteridine diphosphokinase [Chloroherpetonaceae bacterium]MDW8466378.1 2-amino-4-hydroxy-6-hydroxymethyldihydropteridine diphosphokinase [Chloroherpetonaceae bacterium]
MPVAFIGLGANLGERLSQLRAAASALNAVPHTTVLGVSRIYETPPWGMPHQPPFLNAVASIQTALEPLALLQQLKSIERRLGRPEHYERWSARLIDLDILLYDDLVIDEPTLTIPHPALPFRKFALVPLLELANPIHPLAKKPISALLSETLDSSDIVPTDYTLLCC